jgi:hypothetical protein
VWKHMDALCLPGKDDKFLGCRPNNKPFSVSKWAETAGSYEVVCGNAKTNVYLEYATQKTKQIQAITKKHGDCLRPSECYLGGVDKQGCYRHCGHSMFGGTDSKPCKLWGQRCCCHSL